MAALKAHKTISAPQSGDEVEYRIEYDFAKDGGATGALDICTFDGPVIIGRAHATVLTPVTSTGSLTLIWGVAAVDTDRFMTTTQGAKANLTQDAVVFPELVSSGDAQNETLPLPIRVASGGKLTQTIGTEVANAGKVQYVFTIRRA